ncbi:hypothetical protein [Legionella sp. km535]|uniref:hypothetical protein n=1 Tax=Legionella sp. km535 TaxID=2498107 RepID=UPI001F32B71A|nr:hypothetical protein [Legionella sp. km535]
MHASNLPEGTKPFVIGCIKLASWILRALVEHKITVSNLKRLIFGKGDKATRLQNKYPKAEQNNTAPEEPTLSASFDESRKPKEAKGHGRLSHTDFIDVNQIFGSSFLGLYIPLAMAIVRCLYCSRDITIKNY